MAEESRIVLDPEAQSLFEQLGGTESWKENRSHTMAADRLEESLLAEQKRLDAVRISLIQMAYLISRYLINPLLAHESDDEESVYGNLANVLTRLTKAAGHLGAAFIRYRGAPPDPELPDKYDYEVVIGNTAVDTLIAPRVVRRNGSRYAKLPDHLLQAFTAMADYGVNNIFIRLPDRPEQDLPAVRFCLKTLSGFRTARQNGQAIAIGPQRDQQSVPLIHDENLFPDPNLTMVAGLNRLGSKSMENLVQKVDVWLRRQQDSSIIKKYSGVYNAALDLPKISAQLKKPPVELNNVKWLLAETQEETVSLEKNYIAQLVMETAGTSPQKVVKMLKSVYGDDYTTINTPLLGERLHLSSDLLNAVEQRSKKSDLKKEVLGNLQVRLDRVKDQVIDEIQVREDTGREREAGQTPPPDVVHKNIYNMISFFKGRSQTRKKMVGMVHRSVDFTARDYGILAKDFRISLEDAGHLVSRLKNCFSEDGHFKKNAFQEASATFQQYEQKIFAFLWHHMKDAILPEDRMAFLNALQTLTARMNQPKRAFKVLLEDICSDPGGVQFSDNKAVMLANLIIHRPDKSLADYEITPEDIVLNRHNLDDKVVEYAAWRIEKEREPFFAKVQTIHKKLAEALRLGRTSGRKVPLTILLNLERELFIFLTMVACDTAKAILRSAVHEYGDPGAEIYHLKESQKHMGGLLQNLRVALRGVGSVGNMEDIALLESIKQHEETFQRLKKDPQYRTQARRITGWVDEAVKIIKFRT